MVPVRMYVWANEQGTHVSYFDPKPMFTAVDQRLTQGG